jgi:diguanylate cyclase (GGDEF)-like protein/PAS domain S-box-containing protein
MLSLHPGAAPAPARWAACLALALAMVTAVHAAEETAPPLPLRHALEDEALVAPEAVLRKLAPLIAKAASPQAARERALLQLARANACRVIADLHCQRDAGGLARQAAVAAHDALLEVRALIAEGRAYMSLQDYSQGERLLGQAEVRLKDDFRAEYAADIDLGYSSMSHALGKHVLAAEYAERGLARLHADEALPLQVRLLRNHARALTQLQRYDEANEALARGLTISERVADPKLQAELFLEQARLARQRGDAEAQRANAQRVIELGAQLSSSQIAGQGYEVLGLAALDAKDWPEAQKQLQAALDRFRALELARDELRVSRTLIDVMLGARQPATRWEALLERYLAIERNVIQADRAQAADDFDARLKYAQQETEVLRLQSEAMLAQERERSLAETNRLTRFLVALSLMTLLVLATFFVQQRRSNRRLRSALEALRESESRATDLLRLSTGYVFLHDREGRLLMLNPAAAQALGAEPQALVGRSVKDFFAGDTQDFEGYLERVLARGHDEGLLRVQMTDGETRQWRYGNRLSNADAARAYVVGHAVDVTEQVEQTAALRERSERDALTGSYNRRHLDVFESAHPPTAAWAVINVDLDHFKSINDTHGHEHGDRVLIEFAQFLQRHVREGDAVVRTGGDEFVVLLAQTSEPALAALIERLQQDATRAPCAFSLGWALRTDAETLADTLARADREMYARRSRARGTTVPASR